ncbi:unnamed protein product [Schistocephalus solidus]|uniref:Reverse transcriptase domain-containing protein n=1 Tax=Schistocephalus solidus TaxID=70667 RepID=A0A183TC91_SCHSO|nr:unnamed protein product [Schistocephalus solidus]
MSPASSVRKYVFGDPATLFTTFTENLVPAGESVNRVSLSGADRELVESFPLLKDALGAKLSSSSTATSSTSASPASDNQRQHQQAREDNTVCSRGSLRAFAVSPAHAGLLRRVHTLFSGVPAAVAQRFAATSASSCLRVVCNERVKDVCEVYLLRALLKLTLVASFWPFSYSCLHTTPTTGVQDGCGCTCVLYEVTDFDAQRYARIFVMSPMTGTAAFSLRAGYQTTTSWSAAAVVPGISAHMHLRRVVRSPFPESVAISRPLPLLLSWQCRVSRLKLLHMLLLLLHDGAIDLRTHARSTLSTFTHIDVRSHKGPRHTQSCSLFVMMPIMIMVLAGAAARRARSRKANVASADTAEQPIRNPPATREVPGDANSPIHYLRGSDEEKCQEMRTHLYTTFVDLTKAFDTVNHDGMWKGMQKFGCPERFTNMVQQLHDGMMARVTANGMVSKAFAVTNGVNHGCVLAPSVFSLIFSAMLMKGYRDEQPGIPLALRTDGHLLHSRRMQD